MHLQSNCEKFQHFVVFLLCPSNLISFCICTKKTIYYVQYGICEIHAGEQKTNTYGI